MEWIAIISSLIATLTWLGKKYIKLVDDRINKSEKKLQNEINHKITVVVEREKNDINIDDIRLKLKFLVDNNYDLNESYRRLIPELKEIRANTLDNKKDIELIYQMLKSHNKQLQNLYRRDNS